MIFKALKDRFIRAKELATTARETGKRGVTPELGVGEFVRGFIDKNLDKTDAEDPKFTANLNSNKALRCRNGIGWKSLCRWL